MSPSLGYGRICLHNTYIVYAFEGFPFLTFRLPAGQLSFSHACTASDISPRTERDNSQYGRTYRLQKYIHWWNEIGIFATLQYSKLFMDIQITSHIQIHIFSRQKNEYFAVMLFLFLFFNTRMHSYVRIKHIYIYIIFVSDTPTPTQISNKQYSNFLPTLYCFLLSC